MSMRGAMGLLALCRGYQVEPLAEGDCSTGRESRVRGHEGVSMRGAMGLLALCRECVS